MESNDSLFQNLSERHSGEYLSLENRGSACQRRSRVVVVRRRVDGLTSS